jgi:hypothetical protein
MSGMGVHRGSPGRHHRRPVPHFWLHAAEARERKERWSRKTRLSPQELRDLELAAARRRCALLALVAPAPRRDDRLGLAALAELLDQDVAA